MTFSIAIDTTQLTYPYFLIQEQLTQEGQFTEEDRLNFFPYWHEEKPRQPPRQNWDLEPGTYQFLIYYSYPSSISVNPAVSFEVTTEGTVDYPADCDGFFAGRGTSTLTVMGCEVTIDAEKLAGELGAVLAPLPTVNNAEKFFKHKTLRLMPATYRVQQGNSPTESANFSVDLNRDGTFTYDPAFDIANKGFLAGLGTANLDLIGYSIQIDGTQLVYRSLTVPSIETWENTSPHTLNLLPDGYDFQVASGRYTFMAFDVTQQGTIDYSRYQHHDAFLSGQGTKALTIQGYEVTIDARYLPKPEATFHNTISPMIRHQACRMVPEFYTMTQGFGTDAEPLIRLGYDGRLDYGRTGTEEEVGPYPEQPRFIPVPTYDVQNGGFISGRDTSTLTLYGYPIVIDARAVEDAGLGIVSISGNPTSDTSVHLVNLLPTQYSLALNGIATDAKFTLDTAGKLSVDPSLEGLLKVGALHGLQMLKVLGVPS